MTSREAAQNYADFLTISAELGPKLAAEITGINYDESIIMQEEKTKKKRKNNDRDAIDEEDEISESRTGKVSISDHDFPSITILI